MTKQETTPSQRIGLTPTKSIYQILFTVLINELKTRCNKHNILLTDFPPEFIRLLCNFELEGKTTRKRTREFLDEHVKWVKAGKPVDGAERDQLIEYIRNTCMEGGSNRVV